MPDDTSFSLIIPARNAEKTISSCLQAVMLASLQPEEIILVDDGSTDQTLALAAQFPCHLTHIQSGTGPMAPRFAGSRLARSPLLIFIDSDVIVEPGTFAKIIAQFADPQIHAVTGILSADFKTGTFCGDFKNEYMNYIFSKKNGVADFLYGSVWAIRKESLIYFEPICRPFGSQVSDSEMGRLLTSHGRKIMLDSTIQVGHLKPYSLGGLMRNDFVIPFCFSQLLFKYGSGLKRFSHVSLSQTIATTAVFVSVVCLFSAPFFPRPILLYLVAAAFVGLFYTYWLPFLDQLSNRRNYIFVLRAILLLPLDAAVMFCGMTAGLIYSLVKSIAPKM